MSPYCSACIRVVALLALAGVPCAAQSVPGAGPAAPYLQGRQALLATTIEASARAVTVTFPPDSLGPWGWRTGHHRLDARWYSWSATLGDSVASLDLVFSVEAPDTAPDRFGSLDALVGAGRTRLCQVVLMSQSTCWPVAASVEVVEHRLRVTLRDTLQIARLLARRPAAAGVYRGAGGSIAPRNDRDGRRQRGYVTVPVRYVEPAIPRATWLAEIDRERRHRDALASIRRIGRGLVGGSEWHPELWTAVGGATEVQIVETHCTLGECERRVDDFGSAEWSVHDTTVARIASPTEMAERELRGCNHCVWVIGVRPGGTTIRARRIAGLSDTMPNSRELERSVTRPLRVGPPIARVRVEADRERVVAGAPFRLRAVALDSAGRPVPGAPVGLHVSDGERDRHVAAGRWYATRVGVPGRHRVVAWHRWRVDAPSVADSLTVDAVPPTAPARTAPSRSAAAAPSAPPP